MKDKPLILVVDDDPNFLEIMSVKLDSLGYETETAESAGEAIGDAERLMPDLTLMDINMPGGTGTNTALVIKQNPKTKDLKIAFLTNLKEPWPVVGSRNRKIAEELGMQDFLEKTESLDELAQKIKNILAR